MITKTITLTKTKDCKHSVVFLAPKDAVDPIVSSVYISRPDATDKQKVTLTIVLE